jgi:hypothetical protein
MQYKLYSNHSTYLPKIPTTTNPSNILGDTINYCQIPNFDPIGDIAAFSVQFGTNFFGDDCNHEDLPFVDERVTSALNEIINIEDNTMIQEAARMDDEAARSTNVNSRSRQLLTNAELIKRQRTLRSQCTKDYGYIIWLGVNEGLPDVRFITASPMSATSNEIITASQEMSKAAAKFLEDIPFRVLVSTDEFGQFSYAQNRITQAEYTYYKGNIYIAPKCVIIVVY